MNLEITGKLIHKGETQQVKDTFRKREFALDITETQYPNYAGLQLVQQKCDLLDAFNECDMVKVSFNIRYNRYDKDGNVRFFTSLDAWRIEHAANTGMPNAAPSYAQQQQGGNNGGYNNNNGGGYNNNSGFNNNNAGNNFGNGGGNNGSFAPAGQGYNPPADAGDDLPF